MAAVILVASPPELIAFEPEVLEGVLTAEVGGQDRIDVYFRIRPVSDDPVDDPADDPADPLTADEPGDVAASATSDDPTTIPIGGGPSGRTVLALIAFVVLGLAGSTTLLVWSRGG